jgi:hypothetical protein
LNVKKNQLKLIWFNLINLVKILIDLKKKIINSSQLMTSFLNQVNFLVVFNNYVNTIYTNQRIFHREERKLNLDHP